MITMRCVYGFLVGMLLALAPASPATATENPQETLRRYTIKLEELKARDKGELIIQEIGTLRAWLNEAQSYLGQDKEDELELALARVRVQTRLMEVLLAKSEAEAQAKEAHQKADEREREVLETRNEAFELEQKQADLAKQGL